MTTIAVFTTTQCNIIVYDSDQYFRGEKLYILESYHRKTKKQNIRFGTTQQLYSLLIPYQYSVIQNADGYKQLVSKLSVRKLS